MKNRVAMITVIHPPPSMSGSPAPGPPTPTLIWPRPTSTVNGGAIAIGHPLGASGAWIMTTLVNALEQRGARYGLQTMCEGGGMANATIIERLG